MKKYILSIDLGKLVDYTAFSIIEERAKKIEHANIIDFRFGREGDIKLERLWYLRHLDRPQIGTPYKKIVALTKGLMNCPELINQTELVVDASGVGNPVIEMFKDEGMEPIEITITGGNALTQTETGFRVPKFELISALQAWYSMGRLKTSSKLPLAPVFLKELSLFVPKITEARNVTYEALRESVHDDLVMSVAMGVWWGSYSRPWNENGNKNTKPEEKYNPFSYLEEKSVDGIRGLM
jgi:hypothetical protein